MKKIVLITALIFIFLISGCDKQNYDSFAQCLTEKDAVMYGTDWCSHCKNQKKLFGDSFKYINYINCDFNRDECIKAGVTGYPTWIIGGAKYPGEKPLYRLASLTNCTLKPEQK